MIRSISSSCSRFCGSAIATRERVADFEQRHRVELLGHAARQQPHRHRVDHAVAQPHGRHAEVVLDERQDRFFLHHAHLDQHFAQPQALLRTLGQRQVELLRRDDVGADQLLAERRLAPRSATTLRAAGSASRTADPACRPVVRNWWSLS